MAKTETIQKPELAFNPYTLPGENVTTYEWLFQNVTRSGIWRKYFAIPDEATGWSQIIAHVSGSSMQYFITCRTTLIQVGTDDGGATYGKFIFKQPVAITLQSSLMSAIEASFSAASDYSLFSGGTGAGNEGGWYCFKHSTTAYGIYVSYGCGLCTMKRDSDGTWTITQLYK